MVSHRVKKLLFPWEGLALLKKDGSCRVQVYPSTLNPMAVPPCLSPVSPAPDSPQASLVHDALPLLGPKVSGHKHKQHKNQNQNKQTTPNNLCFGSFKN